MLRRMGFYGPCGCTFQLNSGLLPIFGAKKMCIRWKPRRSVLEYFHGVAQFDATGREFLF